MVTVQKYTILSINGACGSSKARWSVPYRFFTVGRKRVLYCMQTILFLATFLPLSAQITAPVQDTAHGIRPLRLTATPLGKNDTILTGAIIYQGDTLPYREMADIYIFSGTPQQYAKMMERWTRLRNAVYVTYPYAVSAGRIINDINAHLAFMSDEKERKAYIKSREKDLRSQFGNQLEQMSVYQGKILMKLINRQTGNNCYEIIREYKGGFNARLYQTVAFFFGSSLKQPYDASGDDRAIESIVQEINRMYSRR
jgi:hypothetical protein